MSDTPETDGITFFATKDMMPPYNTVPAEFARKLERERDKERKVSEKRRTLLIYFMDAVGKSECERDEWKDIAERCIEFVYDQDWGPYACDIIKDYEKLAGGPHPIHSK